MIEQSLWVLDTNTLVSRLLVPGGVAAQAVDRALERGILLVSEGTLAELVEVLARRKFDAYVTQEDRRQFIGLLGGVSRAWCQFRMASAHAATPGMTSFSMSP